jgi:hypothetical protein
VIRIKLPQLSGRRDPATICVPPSPSTPLTPAAKEPAPTNRQAAGRSAADPGVAVDVSAAVPSAQISPAIPPREPACSQEQVAAVLPDSAVSLEVLSEGPSPDHAHAPGRTGYPGPPAVPPAPTPIQLPEDWSMHPQQGTSAAAESVIQAMAAAHKALCDVPAPVAPAIGIEQVTPELGERHAPGEESALSGGGREGIVSSHVNGGVYSVADYPYSSPGALALTEPGQGPVLPAVGDVVPPVISCTSDGVVLPPPGAECQLPGDLVEGYGIKDTRVLTSSEPPAQ